MSVGTLMIVGVWACAPTTQPGVAAPAGRSAEPPAARAAWEDDWERTVAAAKQEGKVVVASQPSDIWRDAITSFQKAYPEISVEYTAAMVSRDFWNRVISERQNGFYLWDARVGGPDNQVYELRDAGALDPVRPLLVRPEVVDDSKWLGGLDDLFVDKEKRYLPGFLVSTFNSVYVNRDIIPETELRSDRDLLDPRWNGRIAFHNPASGPGLAMVATWLKLYGEPFVRDILTKPDLLYSDEERQIVDWATRGRYPIVVGIGITFLHQFQQQGLRHNVQRVQEGAFALATGPGSIQALNRAPNPNARKVFVNWLLGPDFQGHIAQAGRQNSRRLDVPVGDPESAVDAKRLQEYFPQQAEEFLPVRQRAAELVRELVLR
jgi:ABC-type Fe3+ transport system substrate-binding protein